MEMQIEFIAGLRRNSKLLYVVEEKQIYIKKYARNNVTRYACYESDKCKASLLIDDITKKVLRKNEAIHPHADQENLMKKMKLLNCMKEDCINKPLNRKITAKEIFNETLKAVDDQTVEVNFKQIKRTLNKIKNQTLPKCPKTPKEVQQCFENKQFLENYGKSKYNKELQFYRQTIVENNFAYTIFMSSKIVELINANYFDPVQRKFLIDGTFNVAPTSCGYNQLLVTHFIYAEHVYPFLYILTTHKTEEMYIHLFEFLDKNLFYFRPSSFMADFEPELRNAIRKVFPAAVLNGCWFHYMHAVRRRASEIQDFMPTMRTNSSVSKWFRKLLILPLLSPENITKAFALLTAEASTMNLDCLTLLAVYFHKQWIPQETPTNFSVFNDNMRTTSSLEAYNIRLEEKIHKSENFLKFLDCLLDEECNTVREFLAAMDGRTSMLSEDPEQFYKMRDTIIEDLTSELTRNKITIYEFLPQIIQIFNNNSDLLADNEDDSSDTDDSLDENFPEDINECIMCFQNQRNILLQPCNHLKVCENCFTNIAANSRCSILCPFCKTIVQNSIKVLL